MARLRRRRRGNRVSFIGDRLDDSLGAGERFDRRVIGVPGEHLEGGVDGAAAVGAGAAAGPGLGLVLALLLLVLGRR